MRALTERQQAQRSRIQLNKAWRDLKKERTDIMWHDTLKKWVSRRPYQVLLAIYEVEHREGL